MNNDLETPVSIAVYLRRSFGKVSSGIPLRFRATQLDNSNNRIEAGRFTGISSGTDVNGKVQAQFFADTQNILEDKPILISISTPKEGSDELLVGEVTLRLKEDD